VTTTVTTTAPAPPAVTVTTPATTTPGATTPGGTTPPDTTPAKVTLGGVGATVTRSALSKGLKLTVTSDEPVTVDASLLVAPKKVTIAKVFSLGVATATLGKGSGKRTLTLKKKIAGKGKVSAQIRLLAVDGGGNKTAVTKAFTVK
jgi:hypothetical protein